MMLTHPIKPASGFVALAVIGSIEMAPAQDATHKAMCDCNPIVEAFLLLPVIAMSPPAKASAPSTPGLGCGRLMAMPVAPGSSGFNDHAHQVLATLSYRLANITTLPSPDSPRTNITITGASLREPTRFLQFMWRTDIQGRNP